MCDCLICKQVPGLENTVEMWVGTVNEKWSEWQASPRNQEAAARCRQAAEQFLSALNAISEFASKDFHILSEHGTRVKYLQ